MNRLTRSLAVYLPLVAVALLLCSDVALGCPTCKDQLANNPAAQNIARGYFYSILFMLSVPALIFAGLSTYFYLLVRQARKREAAVVRRPAVTTAPARVAGA
jgi:heme/copper-type cytochrome/quinol oxidase subunit 2